MLDGEKMNHMIRCEIRRESHCSLNLLFIVHILMLLAMLDFVRCSMLHLDELLEAFEY